MHSSITLVALLAAGSTVAKVIQIDVGKAGLVFNPSSSTADVGDTLEFHFYSSFHTAVQGDFSTPCMRGSLESTGFNSGPINNMASGGPNVFQVSVKDTNPIWFYCSTPSHCQSGMAGVVNPPSSGDTLANYMSSAASSTSSEGSSTVQGGSVVAVGTQPSAVSGSSSAPASSASSASSAMASSMSSASMASSMMSSSSAASSATSASSSAASVASTSAAGGTSTTSAKPSTSTSSGASGPSESIFKAQGTLMGLAVGLGLLVFLMA